MTFSTSKKAIITSQMLPSDRWWISQGQVHFQDGRFLSKFPALLPEEKLLKKKKIIHPVRPILVVDSMLKPSLPEPSRESHPLLQTNPWLHLRPKVPRCPSHVEEGKQCACIAMGMAGQFHRPSVLPDVCLREGFIRPSAVEVPPVELQLMENSSRYYLQEKEEDDHLLALPTPFPISGQWPGKHFLPAMALEREDNPLRLYFALYDSARFREIAEIYLRPPQAWPEDKHPTFGEPSPNGELGRVAKTLYGLETLQRVGLCAHPCAEPRVLLYCAVTQLDRRVPVYVTDRASPLRVEAAVTEVIRPWYDQGHGRIVCSVCLVQTNPSGGSSLLLLTRAEYIHHWETEHVSSMVASSTFSATQLHTRIHLGHLAYVLALANRRKGPENPRESAVSETALEQFGITERSDILKEYLGPPSLEEFDEIYEDHFGPSGASSSPSHGKGD